MYTKRLPPPTVLFGVVPYPVGYIVGIGAIGVIGVIPGITDIPGIADIVFKKGFAVGRTPGTDYTQTHTQNTPSKQYYLPFEYEHASPLVSLQILVEDFESQPPHASELAIPIASPSLPYTLSIIQSTLFYQTLQSREYHSFHEYLLPYYHDQEVHEVLYLSNHSYSTNAFMSILCVVFA